MLALILAAAEHKPNGSILPGDTNEVIWGTIAFCIIAFALWKFGYGPAKNGMVARRERIEGELDEAAGARNAAETQLNTVRTQLSGADAERVGIIEDAKRTATAIDQEVEQRIEREMAQTRERAERDIAASQQQAMADIQSMVGDLTLGAAELVVRNSLDDATQDDLIETYISQLSSN